MGARLFTLLLLTLATLGFATRPASAVAASPTTLIGIGYGDHLAQLVEMLGPAPFVFDEPGRHTLNWDHDDPLMSIYATTTPGDQRIRELKVIYYTLEGESPRGTEALLKMGVEDPLFVHAGQTIEQFAQSYAPDRTSQSIAEFDLPDSHGTLAVKASSDYSTISSFILTLEYPEGPVPTADVDLLPEPRVGSVEIQWFSTLFGVHPGMTVVEATAVLGPRNHTHHEDAWSDNPSGLILYWNDIGAPVEIALRAATPYDDGLVTEVTLRVAPEAHDRWPDLRKASEAAGYEADAFYDLMFLTRPEVIELLGDPDWAFPAGIKYVIPQDDETSRTLTAMFSFEDTPRLIELTIALD